MATACWIGWFTVRYYATMRAQKLNLQYVIHEESCLRKNCAKFRLGVHNCMVSSLPAKSEFIDVCLCGIQASLSITVVDKVKQSSTLNRRPNRKVPHNWRQYACERNPRRQQCNACLFSRLEPHCGSCEEAITHVRGKCSSSRPAFTPL